MLKFIVCTTIFLRPRRCPEPLLRSINLVAVTLCSYRLLPVSRNIEAPAFNLRFHSKCLGACGIQHLPFLRTALSQSRNCSLNRRDFACFANTQALHNSCCLEQSARRWSCLQAPPSRGSGQPLQLPSHGWRLLGCLMFQLEHHSALLEKLSCWTASCVQILGPWGSKWRWTLGSQRVCQGGSRQLCSGSCSLIWFSLNM